MRRCSLAVLAVALCLARVSAQPKVDLRLTLPPDAYAVCGVPFSLYFDNVVLTEKPEDYRFKVTGVTGTTEARRWTLTPTAEQAGDHRLTVEVSDAAGAVVGQATCAFHITPANAGADRPLRLMVIGDSLTSPTIYVAEMARLAAAPGNPKLTFLGTHRPVKNRPELGHEGYGGWTWQRFASHYEPQPDVAARKFSSPFVFLGADGKPMLDLPRYLKEKCDNQPPDVVTFLLGINDCFGANPESTKAMDERIDAMMGWADQFLAAWRAAAPNADLAIGLTTPPNSREAGFEANYKGRYHRWGWKRIQHRLVERQIAKWSGQSAQRLFVVPTELDLDPVDGYPTNNGVHPNATGYQQIGHSFYAWLKWRVATAK